MTVTSSEPILSVLIGQLEGMVYRCHDDEFWTMEFVSDGCLALTGYSSEALVHNRGVSYEALILADDRAAVRDQVYAALAGRLRFDIEYRIVHADGGLRWVRERGYGVFDGQGLLQAIDGFIQDITAQKETLIALVQAERRFREIFENAHEGIFQTTPEGRYLQANPALARIYGFESPQALIEGMEDISRQLYVDAARRQEFVRRMQLEGRTLDFESQVHRRDGRVIWISENARAVRDEQGAVLYYEGTVEDITDRRAYQTLIERQATHDPLTGLPNRMLFRDRLQHAISRAAREEHPLALLFIDLDHFKHVNDTQGHLVGDRVIQLMAERLAQCLRESDTVARLGGDEFVILLEPCASPQILDAITRRVLETASQPYSIDGRELTLSCSVGVSHYPRDSTDADVLLRHADAAMYEAKHAGRNTARQFSHQLRTSLSGRLESELHGALERDELVLHYQPKISLLSGRIVGAEALLRWQHPEMGLIGPARFIAIAERTTLIRRIGGWAIAQATRQAAAWQREGLGDLPVAVNLSPVQLRSAELTAEIGAHLQAAGLPPRLLELEITEGLSLDGNAETLDRLQALRQLGVRITIDDFGTGYSSLSYLKRFPADSIKIDRSFIHDLQEDTQDPVIVAAIIAMARSLRLKVVAEGIETQAQLEFLVRHGCDEGQGFLFTPALAAEDFAQLARGEVPWRLPPPA